MQIRVDDLNGPEIQALLEEHLRDMHATSPPESVHALDLSGLRAPCITFWTVWDGADLAGCAALKELDSTWGEIKSMRTAQGFRGRGVAALLLEHVVREARCRGYAKLSLETGTQEYFAAARRLYARAGFTHCGPFADYTQDPHSTFMTLNLSPSTSRPSPQPSSAACATGSINRAGS